ncbi:inner membrane protein Mdm31 [Schizosaccharomyces japonicus yFS275]|uniref:Inner membrane protein Mdm31 n=1 Tax=Schizosaccharomyces japonicus (strain yFS275 / FY16936) TaxID=402676 RepID=B6K443_SCHJY|nr:inner membrane protein Mdm31 [Schizosaccharomyces japonicus yFS275]EEB08250.2 inner membrane protein Mdm31 [Schizosaccharomyces japonicus yFS275]
MPGHGAVQIARHTLFRSLRTNIIPLSVRAQSITRTRINSVRFVHSSNYRIKQNSPRALEKRKSVLPRNQWFKRHQWQNVRQLSFFSTHWKRPFGNTFHKLKNLLFRQSKPLTVDNVSAFFSWWLVSHIIWIVVGTTTFFSLLIYLLNTVFAQELLAKWISQLVTRNTGFHVSFDSAIVPNWRKGLITVNKMVLHRRPEHEEPSLKKISPQPVHSVNQKTQEPRSANQPIVLAPKNMIQKNEDYTQFDLTIEKADVSFSFVRWLNGKGIIRELYLRGVHGVVDRRFLKQDLTLDPRDYRRKHNWGDFEFERFKLEDLRVTVLQPDGPTRFPVNVFFCELPRLRKQWLLYDFLNANTLTGSFDNSMFTIHRLQLQPPSARRNTSFGPPGSHYSRLRIDGVGVRHLNRDVTGTFSWITHGNADFIIDLAFPPEPKKPTLRQLSREVWNQIIKKQPSNGAESSKLRIKEASPNVWFDVRLRLNNLRAAVPIFTSDVSYVNNALIRPIVAYINSSRTYIPVSCRFIKPLSDFDGSWTLSDSGILQELSSRVHESFARDVVDQDIRRRRIQTVGIWSFQRIVELLRTSMQELSPISPDTR